MSANKKLIKDLRENGCLICLLVILSSAVIPETLANEADPEDDTGVGKKVKKVKVVFGVDGIVKNLLNLVCQDFAPPCIGS